MARRKGSKKKKIIYPDPIYDSLLIQMLTHQIMKKGKKALASKLVHQMLQQVEQRTQQDPLRIIETGIQNVTPSVEVKARRIGGAVYPIPIELTAERGTTIAIRWLINASKNRSGNNFISNLTNEFIDASKKIGSAIRKKTEVHKLAESSTRLI